MPRKKAANKTAADPERRDMTRYTADSELGLTSDQAAEYTRNGWDNRAVDPPSKSKGEIIRSNVITYFNFIFLVISCLLIYVGAYRELTFLPIIIANSLIGIIQELRAKKTLDELTVLNAPKARVIRDGKEKTVPAEQLVLDDVVLFSAGNQIPADAVVLDGSVSVNESLLTGEADEIRKKEGDHLLSGSFIVSGTCRARLEKVGRDSYVNRLTTQAKQARKGEQSEMIRSLNHIVIFAGICIIPIGILLFYQGYYLQQAAMKDAVTSMVAAVIGMIPEGLYLLTSVTLVVSFIRLSQKKVLVHDMKCIETLARVDVLCVDKTGTITDNRMEIRDVIPLAPFEESDSRLPLETILGDFAAAQQADNITMEAFKAYFRTSSGIMPVSTTGFSSAWKYSSVTFPDASYVLGAPEFLLQDEFETYREEIEEQNRQGYRVLVFGTYPLVPDGGRLAAKITPWCLIVVANQIRKDASRTFGFFGRQGVNVKVISGDNPVTVSQIAGQAGIPNSENYIDATTLKSKDDLEEAVEKYTVFGRVTPDQKRLLVQALKSCGHTVAMTGDGVNDVLALKDADCSVAMAAGSDAAAQAAQLVLLDNDFAHMPEIVMEGRQVVNNMERSGSLFLVKNLFSLLLAIFSIAIGFSYPLKPAQISLISMFTIGVPGFFLSQVPNRDLIRGRFMSNVLLKALPAALTDFFVIAALVVFGEAFNVSSEDISTACAILMAIVGFMILYHIIKPMNIYKWIIWWGCVAGMLFCLIFLNGLFSITGMSMRCIMLFLVFSVVTEPVLRYLRIFIAFLNRLYQNLKQRASDALEESNNIYDE